MSIPATYFDGKVSQPRTVLVHIVAGRIIVEGDVRRNLALQDVRISENFARAPRIITFPDGSYCEVRDHLALEKALHAARVPAHSLIASAQAQWSVAIGALVAAVLLVAAGFYWGLPAASKGIAHALPPSASTAIAEGAFALLDQNLGPTELSAARQQQLGAAFTALVAKAQTHGITPKLLFRKGGAMGPNAMALPDGRVVLLDELVMLADNDAQIMAVLAHELGHVHHRHSLRMLVQSSMAGTASFLILGDISTILAAAPAALISAHYSRGFETESDQYAAALLRQSGDSPMRLVEMFYKLQKHSAEPKNQSVARYLNTHPLTEDRIALLKTL